MGEWVLLIQQSAKKCDLVDSQTHTTITVCQRRKEAKSRTLQVRKDYNRVVREQGNGL